MFFNKYHVAEDPNFNAKRNKAIIDGTIRKNETIRKRRVRAYKEKLGERIDAVGYYFRSQHGGQSSTPIMRYLGKRWTAKLRGERIMAKLQNAVNVRTQ